MFKRRAINQDRLAANLAKLPEKCFAVNPDTKEKIQLRKGEQGFYPLEDQTLDVDRLNAQLEVTPQQVKAMVAGSMFGFDAGGADPDIYQTIN